VITVAGLTPSWDLTYVVDTLTLGAIHRPTTVASGAGGKPLNVARAAAALGAPLSVVAVLGGRTGELVAAQLADDGVAVRTVTTPAETRTCVSIAAADRVELTEIYEYAAPVPPAVWDEFEAALAAQLPIGDGWLAVSGGPPRNLDPALLASLVPLARRAGAQVAVDTHGPSLPPLVAAGPELVKINRGEAAELLGVSADTPLLETAKAIRERTGGTVVITDGADGALALSDDGPVSLPPVTRRGRFPVGSGDCFLAGLLTGLDRGEDLTSSLWLAQAVAAANALVPGQARFERADVDQLSRELRPSSAGAGRSPRQCASAG
jgi:1-phosphofructokinase family hexose kinase